MEKETKRKKYMFLALTKVQNQIILEDILKLVAMFNYYLKKNSWRSSSDRQ